MTTENDITNDYKILAEDYEKSDLSFKIIVIGNSSK